LPGVAPWGGASDGMGWHTNGRSGAHSACETKPCDGRGVAAAAIADGLAALVAMAARVSFEPALGEEVVAVEDSEGIWTTRGGLGSEGARDDAV